MIICGGKKSREIFAIQFIFFVSYTIFLFLHQIIIFPFLFSNENEIKNYIIFCCCLVLFALTKSINIFVKYQKRDLKNRSKCSRHNFFFILKCKFSANNKLFRKNALFCLNLRFLWRKLTEIF